MGTVSDLFRLTLTSCYLFPGFVFYYFSNLCSTLSPNCALLFPQFVPYYFPNLCSSISLICVPVFPHFVFQHSPNLCSTISPISVPLFPQFVLYSSPCAPKSHANPRLSTKRIDEGSCESQKHRSFGCSLFAIYRSDRKHFRGWPKLSFNATFTSVFVRAVF